MFPAVVVCRPRKALAVHAVSNTFTFTFMRLWPGSIRREWPGSGAVRALDKK